MTPRELDLLAATISGEHLAAVRPPIPRPEMRQWQLTIAELLIAGRHEPADLRQALATWRARRAAGDRCGRKVLDYILQDIELDAAAADDLAGARWAVLCPACQNVHEPGEACLWWAG